MNKITLISLVLITISSCGIKQEVEVPKNPYPTLLLGATSIPLSPGE